MDVILMIRIDMSKVAWYARLTTLMFTILLRPTGGNRRKIYDRSDLTSQPVILHNTPTNYSAFAGDLAVLKCAVENLGTKSVVWRKATKKTPLTVGTFTYVGDSRYQIHHVIHRDQWNLHIRNVSRDDAGVYECQVSSKQRDIRRHFTLKVKAINITGKTYIDKGQRLHLHCRAAGNVYPPEELDWFKDGTEISSKEEGKITIDKSVSIQDRTIESTLEIAHMSLQDAGTYVCRASKTLVTNVKVNVLNASSPVNKRGHQPKDFYITSAFDITAMHKIDNSENQKPKAYKIMIKRETKANKQNPPPHEKKRTPDMRLRTGVQEE
ncbi:hypothetical protein FSP39_001982 [Pinctada imbricata]|uniref:Ig-like domain-containing protein n=1 Tax=Pinctada imbricata TaxID=66713 RepID=A0AA89BUM1_PINIB|nr:hypothetical protein FSP39_001982 [Pinctada imbricata]